MYKETVVDWHFEENEIEGNFIKENSDILEIELTNDSQFNQSQLLTHTIQELVSLSRILLLSFLAILLNGNPYAYPKNIALQVEAQPFLIPTIVLDEPAGPIQAEPYMLETDQLRFVFYLEDVEIMTHVLAETQTLYLALRDSVGPAALAASPGMITIEIVPDQIERGYRATRHGILISSPMLKRQAWIDADDDIVSYADTLQSTLFEPLLAKILYAVYEQAQMRSQWSYMKAGIRLWLESQYRASAPQSMASERMHMEELWQRSPPRLQDLLFSDADERAFPYGNSERNAAALTLIDYVVDTYGEEKLSALIKAFGRYQAWDKLIPEVFNISVKKFEAEWQRGLLQENRQNM